MTASALATPLARATVCLTPSAAVSCKPVRLLEMLASLTHLPPCTACLGLAEDGRPLLLRMPSPDVRHVLIAGAAGAGKTELMRAALISLALTNRQPQLQLALIDLKRQGLAPLAGLPHLLAPLATDAHTAAAMLNRIAAEMERRERGSVKAPQLVVAIDDLMRLLDSTREPVETTLMNLAERGHDAGIHLLVSTPHAAVPALLPMWRRLPARLVGHLSDAAEACAASGLPDSGVEQLLGHGDFLAVAAGQMVHFQAAWISPEDWQATLAGQGDCRVSRHRPR